MKNKKLLAILILILAVGAIAVATGVSVAYWTEASALTGYAPQAFTYDYTVWVKYVTWDFNDDNWTKGSDNIYVWGGETAPDYTIAITGFKDFLGEDVVFPSQITAQVKTSSSATTESRTLNVTKIRNSVFSDVSFKAMPTSIVIPPGVAVDDAAFAGLTNLKDVIFGGTNVTAQTTVGAYAFSGCTSLRRVIFETGSNAGAASIITNVNLGADAFLGCDSITSIVDPDNVFYNGNKVSQDAWQSFLAYVGIHTGATLDTLKA